MTAEALMMKHILETLQEDIKESNERLEFLLDKGMHEELEQEEAYSDFLHRDYNRAMNLFYSFSNNSTSRPKRITISALSRFQEYEIVNFIDQEQTREYREKLSKYIYAGTDITLNRWRQLAEGTTYIIHKTNLLIEKQGDSLLSKFPQEGHWHLLDEDGSDADRRIFEMLGARKLFQLHSE